MLKQVFLGVNAPLHIFYSMILLFNQLIALLPLSSLPGLPVIDAHKDMLSTGGTRTQRQDYAVQIRAISVLWYVATIVFSQP